MNRLWMLSVTVFAWCLTTPAFSETLIDKAKKDAAIEMGDDEPAMQQAMERARAGLDDFLRKAGSPPPNTTQYSAKIRVGDGENKEYLWVSELKGQGDMWSGRIENVPVVRSVKKGQSYSFAKSEIVDWTYVDKAKKKVVGNFTTCALLTREPSDVAEALKREYGLECAR